MAFDTSSQEWADWFVGNLAAVMRNRYADLLATNLNTTECATVIASLGDDRLFWVQICADPHHHGDFTKPIDSPPLDIWRPNGSSSRDYAVHINSIDEIDQHARKIAEQIAQGMPNAA